MLRCACPQLTVEGEGRSDSLRRSRSDGLRAGQAAALNSGRPLRNNNAGSYSLQVKYAFACMWGHWRPVVLTKARDAIRALNPLARHTTAFAR